MAAKIDRYEFPKEKILNHSSIPYGGVRMAFAIGMILFPFFGGDFLQTHIVSFFGVSSPSHIKLILCLLYIVPVVLGVCMLPIGYLGQNIHGYRLVMTLTPTGVAYDVLERHLLPSYERGDLACIAVPLGGWGCRSTVLVDGKDLLRWEACRIDPEAQRVVLRERLADSPMIISFVPEYALRLVRRYPDGNLRSFIVNELDRPGRLEPIRPAAAPKSQGTTGGLKPKPPKNYGPN
ncbi:MAG: hypothetical protein RL141_520 [Candidatus Parcubacteria bacterium]|jgi:hypothetical protein